MAALSGAFERARLIQVTGNLVLAIVRSAEGWIGSLGDSRALPPLQLWRAEA